MTSELACSTATKTLARPSRTVIVCVMSVPHISLTLSVMIVPWCGLAFVRPTRRRASKPSSRITVAHGGLARTPAKRNRAHKLREGHTSCIGVPFSARNWLPVISSPVRFSRRIRPSRSVVSKPPRME